MKLSEIEQRIDNLKLTHDGDPIILWCNIDITHYIEIHFLYRIPEGGDDDVVRMRVRIERLTAEQDFPEIFHEQCVKFNDKIIELLDRKNCFEEIEI